MSATAPRRMRSRAAVLALTLGLGLSAMGGVASADRAAPREPTRDWEEGCSWATCWLYELTCIVDGGSATTWEDGNGGYYTECNEKEDEQP